ncbi:hypothetical protein P7C70_g1383, partial [Phenoliferia sp. Uapishka_3]
MQAIAPVAFVRRGRRADRLPTPPPFPSQQSVLQTPPSQLPHLIHSLALPASFSLSTPQTKSLLKHAIYAFALSPTSPHSHLLFTDHKGKGRRSDTPNGKDQVDDAWTLAKAQGDGAGEYSQSRRGKVCGHVFKAGESVYRCRDCSIDSTCVLCVKCFHASSHTKHDVTMSVHAGVGAGCCDCGDMEAFKEGSTMDCKYHSKVGEDGAEALAESADVQQLKRDVAEVLRVLIDWMVSVLEKSPEEIVIPTTVHDIAPVVPPQYRHHPAPSPPSPPEADADAHLPDSFDSTSPPSYISSTSRGKARASSPSSSSSEETTPAGPWSVVLWNDEKHSFTQVIDQVSRATGVTHREAGKVAQRVDVYGRDVVYISSDPTQLLVVSRLIGEIDLAVSVRSSLDTFFEQVAGELVCYMKDLCATKVGGQGGVLSEVLAAVLLERPGGKGMSRFQKLACVDARLWKEARKDLAEVYVTLLGVSAEVKMDLSVHFAQIYSTLAESYLLTDREPEHSIISFGVQVFTVPSVSAFLVSHHSFLSRLISILHSFFTEQLQTNRRHLVLPPNPTIRRIDPESPAFKQKRYFQVFSDFNHLISSPQVRKIICGSIELISEFASFLDLFTSMNPNKRAVSTHVEYESDAWVTAFNVTIQLGKLCRTFGEAYLLASTLELAHALSALLARLPGPRANIHQVEFCGTSYQLIDFRVESQHVSFHHPLAWLFAEMIKNVEVMDPRVLVKEIGVNDLSTIVVGRAGPLPFLAAMDQPLRVIVLVAQIRAGLWVRNGFGMRAQQLHYKEYSLRENTYDQDTLFLQTALVVLDPSLILIAILDRFQVQAWLGGNDAHSAYEPIQAFAMVEEMLYLFILLLSDPTFVAGLDSQACLRREIVHHLCLGPLPYSDLMRRVSERFADDPALDRVLADVSNFKAPVGTSDQGTYTLKPECFAEINPYFSRYSRNQREEADKIVREQMKKLTGAVDPVIIPERLIIERGPFVILSQTYHSDVLHQTIFFAMQHGRSRGELFSEVLVDEAIHLAMLALVEAPTVFASFASERQLSETPGEFTLVHLLVKIEEDDRMKHVRHKVRWCLERLTELVGPSVRLLRKVEDTASPAKALDAKRLAAKARQANIMKQFAQAQKSFLESSENMEDDDEEEMDGDQPRTSLGSCIVCQDELTAAHSFGSLAFIQSSDIIRLTPMNSNSDFHQEVMNTPSSLDRDASAVRPFGLASKKIPVNPDDESGDGLSKGFPQVSQSGLHASACGHMMHLACFETYCQALDQRHAQQLTRCHPENRERREFICPLCKSLGNVLLPTSVEDFIKPASLMDTRDLDAWAAVVLDPIANALDKGVSPDEVDVFNARARQLRPRGIGPHYGLTAWDLGNNFLKASQDQVLEGDRLMTSRLLEVAYPLLQEIGEQRQGFLPNELIVFTISAIEVASRGVGESAAAINEATTRMLQSFLSILSDLVFAQTDSERSSELASLSVVAHIGGLFAPDPRRSDFFALDPLATVVEAAAVMPSAFHQVVAFAYYTELAEIFLSVNTLLKTKAGDVPDFQGDAADDALLDYVALAQIRHFFVSSEATGVNSEAYEVTLGKYLYAYVLPFLRRAAIIQQVVFGSDSTGAMEIDSTSGPELSRLLTMLRIPHPSIALSATSPTSAIQQHLVSLRNSIPGWRQWVSGLGPESRHPVTLLPHALDDQIIAPAEGLQHPAIYELVGLPAQLDTLAAESLRRECDRCGQVPAEPALCLFCGQIVCNQSFCCMDGEEESQHGECNMHMWTCGGSVGIFFLVKKNSVLYLYTDKGTFSTPPYLDSHGEVDVGGRRGRNQFPQFLHQGRYDEIRKTWLNQGIPTFVARKLEASTDHGGWATM